MRSLYSRFVIISIVIMLVSSMIGFLLSNVYYHLYLKPYNSEKILKYAQEVKHLYEQSDEQNREEYLKSISNLGFEIYVVNDQKQGKRYGNAFRKINVSDETIESVLKGHTYNGISTYPTRLFITGFFDNELLNSIGIPIQHDDKQYALFIRPDIQQQLGEMRIFFAVLLCLMVGLSIILIAIAARFIVRPIQLFTSATKKIANGEYEVALPEYRKDEIGTLAVSFRKMAKSLKDLDRMRQEFVSNVSHEFQSPLASIQGFSKTLQTNEMSESERKHYLEIIESESRRMSSLCKQLLTLASLDKEERVLDKKTFDVGKQIRDVIFMLEWQWREKDVAIELDVPSIQVYGDENLLHQVWTNLLTNSIKFTESGGTISFDGEEKDTELCLTISDTGIGMSEDEIDKIFDRFYKVDEARNRTIEGSGLGLSIVKKIIDLHEGSITVHSVKGEGTTFTIYLPKRTI
ncbi:Signal transduction histidine kinase [Bacillus sp. 491mf]|uniref:sensor histidine kinase n=1 Tax=Bacillus TaxID=1386 RepID=UPI000557060A|nr:MULTISPECIES: HAMP domain-containing sensor histidine kinase [unclassified Bacillus (in: firmicutes)]SFC78056.1 Signal transduction histidine kinase [Bacillus sp. 491mf]